MNFLPLSDFIQRPFDAYKARMAVCIVSSEFLGPIKNGGIATAMNALAKHLANDGYTVTLLYTYVGYGKPVTGDMPWSYWVEQYEFEGIELEFIHNNGDYRAWRQSSWLVKEFLEARQFDLVYFNDHIGSGYYSMLAKKEGLTPFKDQVHAVITHGSIEWVFRINDYYGYRSSDIEWMGLERRSVELADLVIAPSEYLLREYQSYGWKLPERSFHHPYPLSQTFHKVDARAIKRIDEIVFFGRLEVRKGLWLFCEALERIADRFPGITVTFLGRLTEFSGISSGVQIINRSSKWPYRVRLLTDFDQKEALAYLRNPGRLAVMPSIADNSPCVVYECIQAEIPFVGTTGSGAEELIHPNSRADVLVQPDVRSLTQKLVDVLENGARCAQARTNFDECLEVWSDWHRMVAQRGPTVLGSVGSDGLSRSVQVGNVQPVLMVFLDRGECTLSFLADILNTHVNSFGTSGVFVVLTDRCGEMLPLMTELLGCEGDESRPPIIILDRHMIGDLRDLIISSNCCFVADIETQILSSFFMVARSRIAKSERAIVTCVVAVRSSPEEVGTINEIPTGDIPGLAELGESIGGSVWAITAASLPDIVQSMEFYDKRLGRIRSSSSIGNFAMMQCLTLGVPPTFIPTVGAVTTAQTGVHSRTWTVEDARRAGDMLKPSQSFFRGGASWFAMSAIGAYSEGDEATSLKRLPNIDMLASEHPYLGQSSNPTTEGDLDLSTAAASLGRIKLALEMETAVGARPGMARHLIDLAVHAARLCPKYNILDLFEHSVIFGFDGTVLADPFYERGQNTATGSLYSKIDFGRILVEAARLRIVRKTLQATQSLRSGGPARLVIVDIPLVGHQRVSITMSASPDSDPAFVRATVFDQATGCKIGLSEGRLEGVTPASMSVDLNGIFANVAINIELSGANRLTASFGEFTIS